MNKIVNNFFLTGDKFIPKLHFNKKLGFTYNTCGPFTRHREKIQKFRKTGNLKPLYKDKLDKTCFLHDAAYSDSKGSAKRIFSDKILKDRAYEMA